MEIMDTPTRVMGAQPAGTPADGEESPARDHPKVKKWEAETEVSTPFGSWLKRYPRTKELRAKRFRIVLLSVVIPVRAPYAEGCGDDPEIGGYFKRGRYRGISSVAFPVLDENGDAHANDRDYLTAPHESPKEWMSHRLWVATGGMNDTPGIVIGDNEYPDPAVAFVEHGHSSGETELWNKAMDSHCALFKDNRIAHFPPTEDPGFEYSSSKDSYPTGFVSLRAVETLRFTGGHTEHSSDFVIMHLALENPTAEQVVEFTQSLRTGEPMDDLGPDPEIKREGRIKKTRAFHVFDKGDEAREHGEFRKVSALELLEIHAKLAVLRLKPNEEVGADDDDGEANGGTANGRPKYRPPQFFRDVDGHLDIDERVRHEDNDIEFEFRLDAGYSVTHRKDPDTKAMVEERRRIFTLSCAIPWPDAGLPESPLSTIAGHEFTAPEWTPARQWGYLLSCGPTSASFFPADNAQGALSGAMEAPAGWVDYATNVGFASIRTSPSFTLHPNPMRLCQTRYVELAILAIRQLSALEHLSEEEGRIANVGADGTSTVHRELADVQQHYLDFRRELWFRQIPRRPAATEFLTSVQDRLGVVAQLEELSDDLSLRFSILTSLAREQEEQERRRQEEARRDQEEARRQQEKAEERRLEAERKATARREKFEEEQRQRAAEEAAARDAAEKEEAAARKKEADDATAAREAAERRKKELLEFAFAIVSILIAIPSFSAVIADPSSTLFGWTMLVTIVLGVLVWVAAKYGKLSKVVDLALPKPKNENHPPATPSPGHNQPGPASGWNQQPQQGNHPYPGHQPRQGNQPYPGPEPHPAKHPRHPSPPPQNR